MEQSVLTGVVVLPVLVVLGGVLIEVEAGYVEV